MPRKQRMYLAGVPAHIIQRGNNREACFYAEQDYLFYLDCLQDACERYQVAIHAYVLMTNHVHLLMTPATQEGISRVMQSLGRRYVQYINYKYRRSGTLWEGRHKASLVDAERYLLTCYRYIELNPVRANMVTHPADYRWSSFRTNAHGAPNPLITPHAVYLDQHPDQDMRQKHYQSLFKTQMDKKELQMIRTATQCSMPVGSDRFKKQIESALERTIGYAKKGRPRIREEEGLYFIS